MIQDDNDKSLLNAVETITKEILVEYSVHCKALSFLTQPKKNIKKNAF
jgi:hypothetical protein